MKILLSKQYLLLLFIAITCIDSCSIGRSILTYEASPKGPDNLIIKEGIISKTSQRIKYKKKGRTQAIIDLSNPIMVAQAVDEEKWGYFQFPELSETDDGTIVVSWQMNEDSHMAYGKSSDRSTLPMISRDKGKTWIPKDRQYTTFARTYSIRTRNGGILRIKTPISQDINSFKSFPEPVAQKNEKKYYLLDKLPGNLKSIYFTYQDTENKWKDIIATINDPGLLRYAINDYMPVVWWGNIKELDNNTLVAGVYPCYYLDDNNNVSPCITTFYSSMDGGYSWELLGKIPSLSWTEYDQLKGDGGFTEPAFEILADSTFLCVMRTGSSSPMYKSFSYDKGKTWTKPVPFTPNGEKPQLMLLKNGVLVLSSGYPGVQLRFSFDGKGNEWSDPIDMIPFMNIDATETHGVTCGYTSLLESGRDSFYIVYSDFTTRNESGEARKSIWFREITVKKRNDKILKNESINP